MKEAPKAARGAATAARRQRGLHEGGEGRMKATSGEGRMKPHGGSEGCTKAARTGGAEAHATAGFGSHRQVRRRCHWSAGGSLDPLRETSGPWGVSRLR